MDLALRLASARTTLRLFRTGRCHHVLPNLEGKGTTFRFLCQQMSSNDQFRLNLVDCISMATSWRGTLVPCTH